MTGAEEGAVGARVSVTIAVEGSAGRRQETAAFVPRDGHTPATLWDRSLMPNGDPPSLTLWGMDDPERRAPSEG